MKTPALFPSQCTAIISDCGKYRYRLTRVWNDAKPPMCWIMLNPSTADAFVDDPTIRRCIGFAKSMDFGGIVVVNLFALRATDPAELMVSEHPAEAADAPVGTNDSHVLECAKQYGAVCAWGANPAAKYRAPYVLKLLQREGIEPDCLGVTRDGHPKHPLYVPANTRPVPLIGGAA